MKKGSLRKEHVDRDAETGLFRSEILKTGMSP